MDLERLVATYGYAAVFVGTFLEGETILVLAGFFAFRGYLDLPAVVLLAFAGTYAGDQLYFHLGRTGGARALASRPRWKARADAVFALLQRHDTALILGFRFLYGIRTVTPFVLGASGIRPLRFLALNGLGAAAWAVAFGTLGYFFGHAIEAALDEVKRYEGWVLLGVAAAGAALWFFRLRKRPGDRPPDPPAEPAA